MTFALNRDIDISHRQTIAILCNGQLHDALCIMVLANNLQRNGHQVTFYSDILSALQPWFPFVVVSPLPGTDTLQTALADKSLLIVVDGNMDNLQRTQRACITLDLGKEKFFAKQQIIKQWCHECFHLPDVSDSSGLVIPDGFTPQAHAKRVVILPAKRASLSARQLRRLAKLMGQCRAQGFAAIVLLSQAQQAAYEKQKPFDSPPLFYVDLHQVAGFMVESGWVISDAPWVALLAKMLVVNSIPLPAWKMPWSYRSYQSVLQALANSRCEDN